VFVGLTNQVVFKQCVGLLFPDPFELQVSGLWAAYQCGSGRMPVRQALSPVSLVGGCMGGDEGKQAQNV
jgi:hypothetical protein